MKKLVSLLLVILAILSVVVGVVYLAKDAGALPHFFPGYLKGSLHKHTKHAAAFIGLAVILLLGAWIVSGSKKKPTQSPTQEGTES